MTILDELRMTCRRQDDDSAWQRMKEEFRRDWRQFVRLCAGEGRDGECFTDQLEATSPTRILDDADETDFESEMQEEAYRFGYAAYHHLGKSEDWDSKIEDLLRQYWGSDEDWKEHRLAVRHGWFFAKGRARYLE